MAKGDEKGLFAFGGSCVITLFQRGRIRFDADLIEQSPDTLRLMPRWAIGWAKRCNFFDSHQTI